MHGNVCDCGFWVADDVDCGTDAVFELADLTHHMFAADYDVCWFQCGVYHANICRLFLVVGIGIVGEFGVGLGAEMKGNMLLCYETCANSSSEVFVEEAGDIVLVDVFSRLEEATGEDSYGIAVCLYQIGHDLCKGDLLFQALNPPLRVRQQRRQGVDIVVVNFADIGVGYDNVGQRPQALNAMCQSRRQDGQGEVGIVEQGLFRQRRPAILAQIGESERVEGCGSQTGDIIIRHRLGLQVSRASEAAGSGEAMLPCYGSAAEHSKGRVVLLSWEHGRYLSAGTTAVRREVQRGG